ncbi:glycosyltransferase family 2 protein [Undibacterium sp. Di26W]|uniref:glycosyltransferase family 2 protein n=1 Tax=Undibacterium sp. Di26W TaxID=3413035 RepID=UPI003BF13729
MKFSLVIPCFNEAANLPLLLERCKQLTCHDGIEVILVDNGSTDNSSYVFAQLLPAYQGCRSIRVEKNMGYGFGILAGLREARGEIIGWTHADLQTDPFDVMEGLKLLDKYGPNIFVKGRRFGRPLGDVLFSVGMSFFEFVLLRKPMWDINAQPSLFSRNFFEKWNDPPHDFSLDLYAYYSARCMGLEIHRFPVFFGKRAHGTSSWNINWAAKRKFIRRTVEFSLQLKKRVKA